MKKILLGIATIGVFAISAYALTGYLTGESTGSNYKTCYYDNGSILQVAPYELCPLSN